MRSPEPAPGSRAIERAAADRAVYNGDVAELKCDDDFVRGYLRGGEVLALSWGWDLGARSPVPEPHQDQRWQDWPIRLHKCAISLRLFGFPVQFDSFRLYARVLMAAETDMGIAIRCAHEALRGGVCVDMVVHVESAASHGDLSCCR